MTSHSLVPKAAHAVGIDFETLCWRILAQTLERADGAPRPIAGGPDPAAVRTEPHA
jgi:hypothetical protein